MGENYHSVYANSHANYLHEEMMLKRNVDIDNSRQMTDWPVSMKAADQFIFNAIMFDYMLRLSHIIW